MRVEWAARSPALRVCPLSLESIATCLRHLERFIQNGRRRIFRSWCRLTSPERFLFVSQINEKSIGGISFSSTLRSFSISFRFFTCSPRSSSLSTQRSKGKSACGACARRSCGGVDLWWTWVRRGPDRNHPVVLCRREGPTTSLIRTAIGGWYGRIHPDRPVSLLARCALKKGHLNIWRYSVARERVWTPIPSKML